MSELAIRQELSAICGDLHILDERAFRFRDDQRHELTPPSPNDEVVFFKPPTDPVQAHAPLAASICSHLYSQCYVRHYAIDENSIEKFLEGRSLTSLFLQANHNKDGWDPGWQIYQTGVDGRLFVQKGDRSRMVMAGEYSTYKWPGVAPKNGDMVSVRMFSGSTDTQPSFFFAFGRTLADQFDEYDVVRFYFNVRAEAAAGLMSAVTATLNRYFVPFKFKSLVDASAYTRADSAVLYVARRYFYLVASLLQDLSLSESVAGGLRDGTPLFTKTLVAGIGMADSPVGGESFGMHRCRLVADGIVDAWLAGSQEVEARMAAIQLRFDKSGISLDAPYVNANALNIFTQPIFSKETQW